ncbi:MAG TPA: NADP-dependent phosphogluconate dehydrogenase [Myxococcaceae bacterium]|jgi:6-phosphogluconate dehydrogenase
MTAQAQVGLAGLGVMGANLAMNMEDHGFSTAVWNRGAEALDQFMAKVKGKKFVPTRSLEEFVASLERPRRIVLMLTAGAPVDMTIEKLKPLLQPGDVVVDGGNSWFKDTQRREQDLTAAGFSFVGLGVSGGEEGARYGPSLMPGGKKEAFERLKPVLEAIAAKTDSGPCTTWVGPDGAGHFVKMVHNGIEYADMQLIAEVYDLLRRGAGLPASRMAEIFAGWNKGPVEGFLIEITAKVLAVKEGQTPLVDLVLDKAGQKGTGKWTTQIALDLGVPVPSIAAALDARVLSSMKEERVAAGAVVQGPPAGDKATVAAMVGQVESALHAAKICTYAQGMRLIQTASNEYKWNVSQREMARIWKGGCIIRARLLDTIMKAFERRADLPSLLLDPDFAQTIAAKQQAWREVVATGARLGIPMPAMSSALAYYDSYRSPELPQNLTQAQRDAFGAHTYQRRDRPEAGFVHTDWLGSGK